MPIVRLSHRRTPFTRIDHRPLEDSRLSWAARGVFAYLLTKPDHWEIRFPDLRRRGNLGRDALYGVLKELERYRYLERRTQRDACGRLGKVIYILYEVPLADQADPAEPDTGSPDRGEPRPADPSLVTNQLSNESTTTTTTTTTTTGGERRGDQAGDSTEALELPKSLSEVEVEVAKQKLRGLPTALAQALLDELEGRHQSGAIRGSSIAYLLGLVKRAKAGNFIPEAGIPIALARCRQRAAESALEREGASAPHLQPANEANSLARGHHQGLSCEPGSADAMGSKITPIRKKRP